MEFLNHISDVLSKAMSAPVLASIAIGIEFAMRMIKTDKPMSIAYAVAGAVKTAGDILTKCGQLMDKVLPQKLK